MFGGGRGMGGGAGGGSVLRVVGRAVTRSGVSAGSSLQEPISSSGATSPTASGRTHQPNSSNHLSISASGSSPFSPFRVPLSTSSGVSTCWPSLGSGSGSGSGSCCDESGWVAVDGSEDERALGFVDDFFLGPVPSADEVQYAVSALQQVSDVAPDSQHVRDKYAYNSVRDGANYIRSFADSEDRISSDGSDLAFLEPSYSRMLHCQGQEKVYDAFHLLQTDPIVKRMVISLSSDKAVWDAVMNNDAVQQLKESYYSDESIVQKSSDEPSDESNPAVNIIRWIFDSTKAKVMEVIENIMKLTNKLFKPSDEEKTATGGTDPFQEKLKTSFLLSIVVLLIVVVSRAHRA